MNLKNFLVAICTCLLVTNFANGQGPISSVISGLYKKTDGLNVQEEVEISRDTLTIRTMRYSVDDARLADVCYCKITHIKDNTFVISSLEDPYLKAVEGVEVACEDRDSIPTGSVKLILKIADVNNVYQYELSFSKYPYSEINGTIRNGLMEILIKQEDVCESPKKYAKLSLSLQPSSYTPSTHFPPLYYGILYVYSQLDNWWTENEFNTVIISMPNLTHAIFGQYYLKGDIIYCDGKVLRWRGNEYTHVK